MIIPEGLLRRAARDPDADAWVQSLPAVCRRLTERWQIDIGPAFAGCSISFVAPASQAGREAVVKIAAPWSVETPTLAGDARHQEATALRIWSGDGAPELFAVDPDSGALLIERCSPGSGLDTLRPREAADEVWAALMTRLHRPTDQLSQFDRLADRADALARSLRDRVSSLVAWDERHDLVARAATVLSELAGSSEGEVLLHGDPHHHNILASTRSPWLAVDPLPMVGDPSYDAVQYLLFRKGDLADPETQWPSTIDRVCGLAGLDPERVRAWTFARLVSDAVAAAEGGTAVDELENRQGDLWTARLLVS